MQDIKQKKSVGLKFAVGVVTAILFVLGLILVAQGFIDTRDYQQAVIEAIQKQTGKTVTIKGKVTVALVPTPTLYIPGIELREADSDHPGPAASADMIRIKVPVMSVFSEHPRISAIVLESPVLELAKGDDRKIRLDWLNTGLMKTLADNSDPGNPLSLEINDGKILYRDVKTDKSVTIDAVNLYATSDSKLDISGGFTVYNHPLQFTLNTDSAAVTSGGGLTPFALEARAGDSSVLKLNGGMDLSQDRPLIQGKLELTLPDALLWVQAKAEEKEELLKQVTNSFTQKKNNKIMLPITLSSDWSSQGLDVDMHNLQLQGLNSGGAGSFKLVWEDWQPVMTSQMRFSSFDYDPWKKLFSIALGIGQQSDEEFYRSAGREKENPLPKDSRVSLNLMAEQFHFGAQVWKNATLSADLSDGAVTVNQFNIELPGDAKLALFGIISQSPTGDMRFEGSMETDGASLRDALTVFDESASGLPQTGFGTFRARSNIFVSSEQLRLSEADVRLSDLHLNGGLAAYFDTKPRIEADMRLRGINFDYFRDAAREKEKQSGQKEFFLKFDRGMNFNWLKRLQTAIDFRVNIDDFTFLERAGKTASFRLYAQQDEFGIHDINFVYPDDTLKGLFKINVAGEQPSIQLTLNTNEIDTNYFTIDNRSSNVIMAKLSSVKADTDKGQSLPAPTEEGGVVPPKPATVIEDIQPRPKADSSAAHSRWSEDLIDMSWMGGFAGSFDLTLGRLKHNGYVLDNVKLQADLANDVMTFKNFTFTYWGGACSVLGSVYGGKVPGISLNAVVTGARLHDMLQSLTGRQNISGSVSATASITTSGVNILSWVSQSEAKVALSARGVKVDGLNLQGVADAVSVSRTASDVFNSVNLALPSGSTFFSVDGGINLKNGIMKTPGIALKSETTVGNLSGEVKLLPWTMELSTIFQFPAMSTETVPTLTVQLAGPLDAPQLRTDTSSLEAFVAKRIISK